MITGTMYPKFICIIHIINLADVLILDCVDSILRQDFTDFELLIVDNGSAAGYAACLEEIDRLDDRIRVIRQDNRGVSAARNTGMKLAKGEYLSFVDADDMVVPFFFSEAYRVAVEQDAAYVVGGEVFTPDRSHEIARVPSPEIEERESGRYREAVIMVTDRLPDGGFFGRGPVARLIKKEIAEQVLFPENMKLGEDVIWNLDVLSLCDKVYMVHQIWYLYWKHPESASHRYQEDVIQTSEYHLTELAGRIDFSDEKEATTYFLHAYEFLRRHVFGCYFGKKECPLPVLKRAREFHALCQRAPWNLYESHVDSKHCGRRTRNKLFLMHSRLLYWFWFFRSRARRDL